MLERLSQKKLKGTVILGNDLSPLGEVFTFFPKTIDLTGLLAIFYTYLNTVSFSCSAVNLMRNCRKSVNNRSILFYRDENLVLCVRLPRSPSNNLV